MKYIILFLLPILTWSNAKNIVFIISDDLKADALNCYGNKSAYTPNIDKLASEGTLFQNAYCQGTVCAPSRASFMRGNILEKMKSPGVNIFKIMDIQVPVWARYFTCEYQVT